MKKDVNGYAVAALILGILGLIFILEPSNLYHIVGFVLCATSLIMSIVVRRSLAKSNRHRGLATAGMILSIIGIVIGGVGVLTSIITLAIRGVASFIKAIINIF